MPLTVCPIIHLSTEPGADGCQQGDYVCHTHRVDIGIHASCSPGTRSQCLMSYSHWCTDLHGCMVHATEHAPHPLSSTLHCYLVLLLLLLLLHWPHNVRQCPAADACRPDSRIFPSVPSQSGISNPAAAVGLDTVQDPNAKLPVSQCTKTEGKKPCPLAQEQACCGAGTCTTIKVLI
jgi:hypothetical protein